MKEKIIFTNGLIDLAQPRLGTKVIYKTDDFFASANRIISPTNLYLKKVYLINMENGWMDGSLEEKELKGHDYIILKLGKPGKISKIDVDTSHFNGNQPAMVSLEGAYSLIQIRLIN
jgi:allantoicase